MPDTYGVDSFTVPGDARDEFWRHVRRTHDVLRAQPGFIEDHLLEDVTAEPVAVVTVVRWRSDTDLEAVKAKVFASHTEAGFDPPSFFAEHAIEADRGDYAEANRDASR